MFMCERKNTADAKTCLDKCYPGSALAEWFDKFCTCDMSTVDDAKVVR